MSFTPQFQEIINKCQKMSGTSSREAVQGYFKESMIQIGHEERLRNLYRIRLKAPKKDAKGRIAFFSPNRMQEDYLGKKSNRDLFLKMRQGGATTLSCIRALDLCLFQEEVSTAIMAHVKENVKKFFRISKSAFNWFQKDWHDFYPVSQGLDNVTEFSINETKSSLVVSVETKGLTLDYLHISEAAFVEDDRISESMESVSDEGTVILETTPNTVSGLFYQLWEQSQKDPYARFKAHFYPWWWIYPEDLDNPLYQPSSNFKLSVDEEVLCQLYDLLPQHIVWRRLKISECGGDEGEFQRKYPEDPMSCFLSGSHSVFPVALQNRLLKGAIDPPFMGELILNS